MSKKILITGINGFVGHHVAVIAHAVGHDVVGIGNQAELAEDLVDSVSEYLSCDLTDAESVKNVDLQNIDAIINLAGFAKVGDSRGQGELYNKVNVGVHTVLYDECLRQKVTPRIIAVSTGAVYDSDQQLPLSEDSYLISDEHTNEYVVSKLHMEQSLIDYREKNLNVIIARPFNHAGPRQLSGFLVPDLLEQIKSATVSDRILRVGNLKTKRDYTDVRDVAKAYLLLATADENKIKHNTYNICSGRSTAGEDILAMLLNSYDASGLKVELDPAKVRKNDVMDIYGSFERIHKDIGWSPTISLEKMIGDFVDWSLKHA